MNPPAQLPPKEDKKSLKDNLLIGAYIALIGAIGSLSYCNSCPGKQPSPIPPQRAAAPLAKTDLTARLTENTDSASEQSHTSDARTDCSPVVISPVLEDEYNLKIEEITNDSSSARPVPTQPYSGLAGILHGVELEQGKLYKLFPNDPGEKIDVTQLQWWKSLQEQAPADLDINQFLIPGPEELYIVPQKPFVVGVPIAPNKYGFTETDFLDVHLKKHAKKRNGPPVFVRREKPLNVADVIKVPVRHQDPLHEYTRFGKACPIDPVQAQRYLEQHTASLSDDFSRALKGKKILAEPDQKGLFIDGFYTADTFTIQNVQYYDPVTNTAGSALRDPSVFTQFALGVGKKTRAVLNNYFNNSWKKGCDVNVRLYFPKER